LAPPRWLLACSFSLILLVGCSGAAPPEQPSPTGTASVLPPTASPPATALVETLPAGCDGGVPAPTATITFVAGERAWAVAPDGTGLVCLFDVTDPGSFAWGPKGDRVALGGLAVRGVGTTASRPAAALSPEFLSWGRPTGKAVAFSVGPKLEKAVVGSDDVEDITPLNGVSYREVAYHPSGLAIAFVLNGAEGSAIWISSNTGDTPKRLVWSKTGTTFGGLAFDQGGDQLFYTARPAKGANFVARLVLSRGRVEQGLWKGERPALRLLLTPPGLAPSPLTPDLPPGAAIDAGSGCSDRQALFSALDGHAGTPLLPDVTVPTTALGWLDGRRVLVAAGACDGPFDLWIAYPTGGSILVARDVDRGAVRVPEPANPPPLPDLGVESEFA
jgi:hypothetical protein